MLTYSSLTEAWDGKKKKKECIKTNQVILESENKVKDPLVMRIYDENILEKLSIYKEDYKIQLLHSILHHHFNDNKKNVVTDEETQERDNAKPTEIIKIEESDDVKDIIIFLTIGIIILLSMEFLKNNVKVLIP